MSQLHYWGICDELLTKPHLLIAGSTGSGKSVLINSILYTLLTYQPTEKRVMLIDPKRVELYEYKRLPHCIGYASKCRRPGRSSTMGKMYTWWWMSSQTSC